MQELKVLLKIIKRKGIKRKFKIIVKILSENNILIEAETNKEYRTIEKLKKEINNTNIPFDNSNYFVKKAEEKLEEIKNGES